MWPPVAIKRTGSVVRRLVLSVVRSWGVWGVRVVVTPQGMSRNKDVPELDDVMVPTETVHPDHREHAKSPKHVDDDELARRAQHEQQLVDEAKQRDS